MKYYRLKQAPNLIFEGFLFGGDPIPDWFMDKVTSNAIILHMHHKIPHAHIYDKAGCSPRIITAGAYYVLKGISGNPVVVPIDKFNKQFEEVFTSREVNKDEVSK